MNAATGLFIRSLDEAGRTLFRRAADLADDDDPVRIGIGLQKLERVDEVHSSDRVAADADARRLTDPASRELPDGLVRQRPGSRDDADVAWPCGCVRA
jgi:hypothetical protein